MMMQTAVGLFLDPGLGKTSICLSAFKLLKEKGYVTRALIIAPLRPMYSTWPAEIWKWTDFENLTYSIVHGSDKESRLWEDVDIHLINPDGLLWLLSHKTLPEWDVLIIDESTKFKDTNTQRFKLIKPLLAKFKRRWILTGTPVPNGLMDLFGQIYILDQGAALGRYITHFRNAFFFRSGFNMYDWKPMPDAFERIIDKISHFIIQLSAEDWIQMPELMKMTVSVELPPLARKSYDEVEENFLTNLTEGMIVAANAGAAGVKCRQIANGAVYTGEERKWAVVHDTKLDALEDLLEELNGHPVLLLYEFDHDRQRIMSRFPSCVDIKGGDIAKMVDRFNRGDIGVLLGHPASMGHGLNLQGACHHVIWFGITWNLEYYDQAIARVHRQGQKSEKVFVYHIIANNTLDERVVKILGAKSKTQQDLLTALGAGTM